MCTVLSSTNQYNKQGGAKAPFYVTQLQKLENQVMGPYSGEYQS